MSKRGLLLVLSGPSGSGKGTVLGKFLEETPNAFYSVSATTRAPRPGEVDGVNYYFLTKEQFEAEIRADGMLEYAVYVDNYYGTPKKAVEEQLAAGNDVVLEIEVQGALQVKAKCPDAVTVFLKAPSMEELYRRLVKRGTETEEVIRDRLKRAEKEMTFAPQYDYIVVNDEVDRAKDCIRSILSAEKCRSFRADRE